MRNADGSCRSADSQTARVRVRMPVWARVKARAINLDLAFTRTPNRLPGPHPYLKLVCAIVFLFCSIYAGASFSAEPFFVTIQKVDLKNEFGEWVTVMEPDKKVDLAQDEPSVSFFNNGRVPPGKYVNVRVRLDQGLISRIKDYALPLDIKKGSFVNVAFGFDFSGISRSLGQDNFKQIQLTVDDEDRLDGADQIKIER